MYVSNRSSQPNKQARHKSDKTLKEPSQKLGAGFAFAAAAGAGVMALAPSKRQRAKSHEQTKRTTSEAERHKNASRQTNPNARLVSQTNEKHKEK